MSECCPTCGAVKPHKKLGVTLSNTTLIRNGERLELTNHEAIIMDTLINNMPFTVSKTRLISRMYEGEEEPDCAEGSLEAHVSKLRIKLKPIGLGIVNTRYRGYNLLSRPLPHEVDRT